MAEFCLPSLGPDMETGTLLEWKVKVGDRVSRGDVLAVVDTEKAAFDVETFLTGVVEELLVMPGAKVPVGAALARVHVEGEVAGAAVTASSLEVPMASAPIPAPAVEDSPRRERLRAAIASAMSRSNREVPHYYLATTLDVTRLLDWLSKWNEGRPPEARVLLAAALCKATARALREVPELNGTWLEDRFVASPQIHLGVATSIRGGGVLVPVIHDADALDVAGLMEKLRGLVSRARGDALRAGDLDGATITVTNLGDDAPDEVFGVIFPPQVALVGFGGVSTAPRYVGEVLMPRKILRATLAADHRATDGHVGARFLVALERELSAPEAW